MKRTNLTAYDLACGYVQRVWAGKVSIALWHEHCTYHVRAHDFGLRRRVFWDTFRTLTEARKRFAAAIKGNKPCLNS